MEEKLKRIKKSIQALIEVLELEYIEGPIPYLESCLDELGLAQEELKLYLEENGEE